MAVERPRGLALRDAIIEAAIRIVERSGNPDDITIRSIAAEAGVSQPAVYLHFQSRDELVHEVALRMFREHRVAFEEGLAEVRSPIERIVRRAYGYLEFAREQPGVFHTLLMSSGRERDPDRFEGYDKLARTGLGPLIDDIAEAMEAGLVRRGDPETAAVLFWAGIHGVGALLLSLPGFPWPERQGLIRAAVEAQLVALRAGRTAAAA